MYVADSANGTIRRVALADGAVTTIIGLVGADVFIDGTGTNAQLDLPLSLWGNGDKLYLTEGNNSTVREIAP